MYMILTLFFKIKTQYKYGIGETTTKKNMFLLHNGSEHNWKIAYGRMLPSNEMLSIVFILNF